MDNLALQISGWSAYLSAAATVLTFITGILFFTIGEPFGKINDISSVFQMLFMLSLALILARFIPAQQLALGWIATLIGVAGMLVSAYGQSLLVLGRIDFQASIKFFPAGGAIGAWLILISLLGYSRGELPDPLVWTGLLAGAGYLITVIGFLHGGQQIKLFLLGGLVLGISYPIWAIWLGRLLLSGAFGITAG